MHVLTGDAPAWWSAHVGRSGVPMRCSVSVSVFEDQAGLTEGARLLGHWETEQQTGWLPDPPEVMTGEVVVQKGM